VRRGRGRGENWSLFKERNCLIRRPLLSSEGKRLIHWGGSSDELRIKGEINGRNMHHQLLHGRACNLREGTLGAQKKKGTGLLKKGLQFLPL